MQRVGRGGQRAVVGDGAQGSQAAEVDHEAILRVTSTKSNRSCRSRPSPSCMPRRQSPSPPPSPSSGASTSSSSMSASTTSLPCCSRRCASPGRARAPVRAAPGVPARYVIAVGVFLSAGQFALLFLGIDQGCRPAWRRSCCSSRPRSRSGSRCCSSASALAPRSSRAVRSRWRHRRDRRRPRPAVPLGALALTVGAAASLGHRQRRDAQGALAATRRPARVVEPRAAAAAARAQPADRAREAVVLDADRRARAALRRRALDAARLRRVGLAARPAPRLRGRAVHAARAVVGIAPPGSRSAMSRAGRVARAVGRARRVWRSPWA